MVEKEQSFQAKTLNELKKIMWDFIITIPAECFMGVCTDTILNDNNEIIGWVGKVLYDE
jgi:hypothetical protein